MLARLKIFPGDVPVLPWVYGLCGAWLGRYKKGEEEMIFLKIIHVVSLSLFWAAFSVFSFQVQSLYGKPRGAAVRGERVDQLQHFHLCYLVQNPHLKVIFLKIIIWKLHFESGHRKLSSSVVIYWRFRRSLKTTELWMQRQTRASAAVAFFDVITKLFVKYMYLHWYSE